MKTSPINKFYVIYHNLLENKNEQQFVSFLSDITKELKRTEFNKIKNIKSLIFNLEKKKLLFAYKISLLTYIKFSLSDDLAKFFDSTEYVFEIDSIIDNLQKMHDYDTYIESFKIFPVEIKPLTDTDQSSDIKIKDMRENTNTCHAWYTETRLEIINRFIYLRNYFGLEVLQKFKIKNTTYEEICNMNYKKIAKFYNKIVDRIKKCIKKNLRLCDVYLEIEEQIVTSMITSDNVLKLDNFSLVIDFGDSDSENESDDSNKDEIKLLKTIEEINTVDKNIIVSDFDDELDVLDEEL